MSWDSISLTLFILSCFLLFLLSIIPLVDGRKGGIYKWIAKKKKEIQIYIGVFALLMQISQFEVNKKADDEENIERDSALYKYQKQISIKQKRDLDSNERRIIQTYTEALAKFGLRSDSLNGNIVKTVNESTAKLAVPELGFCEMDGIIASFDGTICEFTINICNNVAPATNINIEAYYAYSGSNELHYLFTGKKENFLIKGEEMKTNTARSFTMQVKLKYPCEVLNCLIKGSFKDRNGNVHKFRQIGSYDLVNQVFGFPLLMESDTLMDTFRKHNV